MTCSELTSASPSSLVSDANRDATRAGSSAPTNATHRYFDQ